MQNTHHMIVTYRHLTQSVLILGWRDMAYSNDRLIALLTICVLSHEVLCGCQAGISARAPAAAAIILAASRGGGVFFAFFLVIADCHKKNRNPHNTPHHLIRGNDWPAMAKTKSTATMGTLGQF